jgi:hypothetical protein
LRFNSGVSLSICSRDSITTIDVVSLIENDEKKLYFLIEFWLIQIENKQTNKWILNKIWINQSIYGGTEKARYGIG